MQVVYSKVTRSATIDLLREHLQRNIVRIGKQWHYQSNGIPQVRLSRLVPTRPGKLRTSSYSVNRCETKRSKGKHSTLHR